MRALVAHPPPQPRHSLPTRLGALVDGAEGPVLVAVVVEHVPQVLVARRHDDPQPPHRPPLRAHDELRRTGWCRGVEDCGKGELSYIFFEFVYVFNRDVCKVFIRQRFGQLHPERWAFVLHQHGLITKP
jgi:hypothetical protein